MFFRRLVYFVLFAVAAICPVAAQNYLQVPYFCGFEDNVENANWHSVTSTDNDWYVGNMEKSLGDRGIYVAHNGGNTIGTSTRSGYMSLYRDVTLEAGDDYEISFDWKNQGIGSCELYVCWIDEAVNPVDRYSSATFDFPTSLKASLVNVGTDNDILTSSSLWRNVVFSVTGTGRPMRLCFFFRNRGTSVHEASGRTFPAACIDNVQITRKYDCIRPSNLAYTQIDQSRGKFTWNGGAGPFMLMYKCVSDTAWTTVRGIQTNELPVRPLRKGAYIAKVRQICCLDVDCIQPADTSMWASADIVVPYSDNSCIDFLDLTNTSIVTCYTGDYVLADRDPCAPIDFGPGSEKSRHTVHYDPYEFDKWTNYNLKTTPPDGLPSVRLGNYTTASDLGSSESMAEAITYHYWVNPDAPILLLKFAILFEDPNHGPEQNPKFDLVITDPATGDYLDDVLCGRVNFTADINDPDLKRGAVTTHDGSPTMLYKDWTTTGMNLQALAGQNIDITFISKECARTGHASYAYFTMDCMGAKISGIGCGDEMFGAIEAPDGFRYKWYPKKLVDGQSPEDSARILSAYFADPAFADTNRTYTPPVLSPDEITEGDGIYVCRIISTEVEECWFELEADLDPRDVFAGGTIEPLFADCKATYKCRNKSYTETRNRHDIGVCDYIEWNFISDTGKEYTYAEDSPNVVLPPGTYNVTLHASISEDLCSDDWDTTIVVPQYGNTVDTVRAHRCTVSPNYEFEGTVYSSTGVYTKRLEGFAGCDSIRVLDLIVEDEVGIDRIDTITDEQLPYIFRGQSFDASGVYDFVTAGIGEDCDTFWHLELTVIPVLHINFDTGSLPYTCYGEDDSLSYSYSVANGTLGVFDLVFDEISVNAGFENRTSIPDSVANGGFSIPIPAGARPGSYPVTVVFRADSAASVGEDVYSFSVDIYYPSDILVQKWNDVIAVKNAANNGGYDFSGFQWYHSGLPISGAVGPYLYLDGGTLSFGDEYSARLRRSDDGVVAFTCPIVPVEKYDISDYPALSVFPTVAAPRSVVQVDLHDAGSAVADIYDVLGRHYGTCTVDSENSGITLPDRVGLFVIRFSLPDGSLHVVKVTVR